MFTLSLGEEKMVIVPVYSLPTYPDQRSRWAGHFRVKQINCSRVAPEFEHDKSPFSISTYSD